MRRDEDVLEVPQRMAAGKRFGVGHVECRAADVVALKRTDQRVGIDDWAAGHVGEHGVRMHRPEHRRVNKVARRVGERAGEPNVLRVGDRFVDLVEAVHLVRRATLLRRVSDADGLHVESARGRRCFADFSQPDDADASRRSRRCGATARVVALVATGSEETPCIGEPRPTTFSATFGPWTPEAS